MKPDQIPSADTSPLDGRQCLRLLAATRVGRVVYTVGALPAVLPTRYRLDADGSVLLSAAGGSELVKAVSGALVAFEAGEVSESDGSGWSVTVLGRADVTEAQPPHGTVLPRRPGQVSIRIRAELVTGRLLPEAGADPAVTAGSAGSGTQADLPSAAAVIGLGGREVEAVDPAG